MENNDLYESVFEDGGLIRLITLFIALALFIRCSGVSSISEGEKAILICVTGFMFLWAVNLAYKEIQTITTNFVCFVVKKPIVKS